jgi:hypothetical protein
MNKPTRRRRTARRGATRTLAIAAAMAALLATLGAGQALAGPDERVLERQGRIQRQAHEQATAGQAHERGKAAAEHSQGSSAQYPRRFFQPEPKMSTEHWVNTNQTPAPAPAPTAPENSRRLVLAITLGIVALLLAFGAAATWRIQHRRPRPEPTT